MPHHLSAKCRLYIHQNLCPNQLQSEIPATLNWHYKASTVPELKNFIYIYIYIYICLIMVLVVVSIRWTLCDVYTKRQESKYVNTEDKLHVHLLHFPREYYFHKHAIATTMDLFESGQYNMF